MPAITFFETPWWGNTAESASQRGWKAEGGFRLDVLAEESCETTPRVVDVSVVHPLHPSSSLAEVTPGTAAAQRELAKHTSEAAKVCSKHKWRLTAVAVETTGCWGPEAQKCIRGLARKHSMRLGVDLPTVSKQLWRRLSSAVAKGVARMMLRGFSERLGAAAAHVG